MKITEFCLENRTTTLFLTVVIIVGGLFAFSSMGRLEDPDFVRSPIRDRDTSVVEDRRAPSIEELIRVLTGQRPDRQCRLGAERPIEV